MKFLKSKSKLISGIVESLLINPKIVNERNRKIGNPDQEFEIFISQPEYKHLSQDVKDLMKKAFHSASQLYY